MSEHELVVGGTGMLRGVVEHLLDAGSRVTVMARGRRRFGGLSDGTGALNRVAVDYTDDEAFATALDAATGRHVSPDRVVAWIHDDTAPAALALLARALVDAGAVATLWEIVASVDEPVAAVAARHRERLRAFSLDHRQIILGYAPGPPWRWLTDCEIAGGVIAAIGGSQVHTIIGTTEPWPPG